MAGEIATVDELLVDIHTWELADLLGVVSRSAQ